MNREQRERHERGPLLPSWLSFPPWSGGETFSLGSSPNRFGVTTDTPFKFYEPRTARTRRNRPHTLFAVFAYFAVIFTSEIQRTRRLSYLPPTKPLYTPLSLVVVRAFSRSLPLLALGTTQLRRRSEYPPLVAQPLGPGRRLTSVQGQRFQVTPRWQMLGVHGIRRHS